MRGSYAVQDGSEASPVLRLAAEDLLFVSLAEPRELVAAVEITLDIPRPALEEGGSFALYVYDEVKPEPSPERKDYRGRQALLKPLGDEARIFLRIPLDPPAASPAAAPGTTLLRNPKLAAGSPWALTILPIMKGLPDSALHLSFSFQARPVFRNRGKIAFVVLGPDGPLAAEAFSLTIDDKPVAGAGPLVLEPGIYKARIESAGLSAEQLSVMVEKGKSITIETRLKKPFALFKLDAPPAAKAFLDGKEIDHAKRAARPIEPGEHTLTVMLGEYQVNKRFTAQVERSYTFNVFFDILMKEN